MEVKLHGKMLLLTFEDGEDDVLRYVLGVVELVSFQELCTEKCVLKFQGLEVDEVVGINFVVIFVKNVFQVIKEMTKIGKMYRKREGSVL